MSFHPLKQQEYVTISLKTREIVYSVVFGSPTKKEIASPDSASRDRSKLLSLDLLWEYSKRCSTEVFHTIKWETAKSLSALSHNDH